MTQQHKTKPKLSSLAFIFASLYSSHSFAQDTQSVNLNSTETSEEETITVYGRHNRLVLESGTATKSNMSLMETPAAIVIVDSELLSLQGNTSLQDVLSNVSGLSQDGNNYGIGDNLSLRGLGVNYTYDGMYGGGDLGNSFNPTRSLTNIESIEVLKGPATGLYGIGSAGGVINMIEKKPQDEAAFNVRLMGGSWNTFGVMLDATAAITDDVAYRLVLNHEESDGYRGLSEERAEAYGSLRFNISDDNSIIVSAAYIDDAIQIDSVGHPVRLFDLTLFDTDASGITASDLVNGDIDAGGLQLTEAQQEELAASLAANDGFKPYDLGDTALISPISTPNEGEELRLKIRQDLTFGNDWAFTHQAQYRNYTTDYVRQTGGFNYVYTLRNGVVNLDPRAPLVEDGVLYPYAVRRQEYRKITAEETSFQYFADLSKTWASDNIEGEHLGSFYYESRDTDYQQLSIWDADDSRATNPVPYIYDFRDPNWPTGTFEDYLSEDSLRSKYDKKVAAFGISFQEVLYFGDFTARIGGAYSGVEQTYQNHITTDYPEYDTDDAGFTYNLGLTYKIADNISTFLNHSKGQTAYSILGSVTETDNRPNSESESWDLGVRFTALEEQLLGSVIYFDTARTNLRYTNPAYEDDPEDAAYNVDVPQYYFDENDRTTGFEVDINFDINDQWALNINGTYQDAVTEPGAHATSTADEPTKGIADKLAGAWLTYSHPYSDLDAPIDFSLGFRHVGERTISASAFGVSYAVVDAYTVWDAAVTYNSDNWNVQLNLRNLADADYYSGALYLGGLPGAERNAQLTVNYNF